MDGDSFTGQERLQRGNKKKTLAKAHLLFDGDVVARLCVSFETHGGGRLGGCGAQDQALLRRVIFPPSAAEAAVKVLVAFELEERRCAEVRSCGRGRRGVRGGLGRRRSARSIARENHS